MGQSKRIAILHFSQEEIKTASLKLEGGISLHPSQLTRKADHSFFPSEQNFGMFGDNSNTFYPGLDVKNDVVPKPEDFIDVPFRLISATTVGAYTWKATDFSLPSILESSQALLLGKPLYSDHDASHDNWKGFVKSTWWEKEYILKDGTKVPAGINGVLSVDAKSNPKTARGVLLKTLGSNSVTVTFEYKKSHADLSDEVFDQMIGQMHQDGTMIRRVVTKIFDYYETSFVFRSADPFAKILNPDGSPNAIDKSRISYEQEQFKTKSSYVVTAAPDKALLSYSQLNISENMSTIPTPGQLPSALESGVATSNLSLKDDEIIIKKIEHESFSKTASLLQKVESFLGEKELTEEKLTALFADKELVAKSTKKVWEEKAELADKILVEKRDQAIHLYKVAAGEKTSDAVIELFSKADIKALDGLIATHVQQAGEKFAGTCKKCGATEFSFRSTTEQPAQAPTKRIGSSLNDIHEVILKKKEI